MKYSSHYAVQCAAPSGPFEQRDCSRGLHQRHAYPDNTVIQATSFQDEELE